jgi:hypothetical protein
MRKTHQSALALKQALIQELQDIIAEKDEIINTKIRNNQADDVTTKPCFSESQVFLQYYYSFTSTLYSRKLSSMWKLFYILLFW